MKFVVACGTSDGELLTDDHFGESKRFYIFRLDNFHSELVTKLDNTSKEEDEDPTHGDPQKAKQVSDILLDHSVNVVLAHKMGPNVVRISKNFVPVVFRGTRIDTGLQVLADNLHLVEREWRKGVNRGCLVLDQPDESS